MELLRDLDELDLVLAEGWLFDKHTVTQRYRIITPVL